MVGLSKYYLGELTPTPPSRRAVVGPVYTGALAWLYTKRHWALWDGSSVVLLLMPVTMKLVWGHLSLVSFGLPLPMMIKQCRFKNLYLLLHCVI